MLILSRVLRFARVWGMDLVAAYRAITGAPRFVKSMFEYKSALTQSRFQLDFRYLFPALTDWGGQAGQVRGHYFHQDLWAARRIFAAKPERHVDVGSRIDGFVSHLLTFMTVEVVDIRPLQSQVDGLLFIRGDATMLSEFADNSVESLSSLHAVEHFGLGRYGDRIEPDACFQAMAALARVLAVGGRLYFSVPIGIERLEFNAHRVFSPRTVLETFGDLSLVSFSAVDDLGDFCPLCSPDDFEMADFGCGLFEFTKTAPF